METNPTKIIHEKFHATTKGLRKIIDRKNFTYRHLIKTLDTYIKHGSTRILDVGSGAGALTFYLANKGNETVGIDISFRAIAECKRSAKKFGLVNVKFIQSEFPHTEIEEKFEAVIFTEVIEHLPKDDEALEKINSLLVNSGILLLSTPSITAPLYNLGLTHKFDQEVGHIRRYSLSSIVGKIRRAGFKVVEIKRTEGIVRNFLFVNPYAGKLVRFLNYSAFLSDVATAIDNLSLKFFGESNYIIVAKKVSKKNTKNKKIK